MSVTVFLIIDILFRMWTVLEEIDLDIIVNILNFIFVIWVFYHNKKQAEEQNIKNYQMSWYRTFDFEKNIETFRKALDRTKENLASLSDALLKNKKSDIEECAKNSLEEFDSRTLPEKQHLQTILSCIDNQTGIYVAKIFNEFQDILAKLVNDAKENKIMHEKDIEITLNSMEQKLTLMLYRTGLQFT